MEKDLSVKKKEDKKDANTCMALGIGVGTLGAASAVLTGVVCPLCVFIAPGLIGLGAYRRWWAAKMIRRISSQPESL